MSRVLVADDDRLTRAIIKDNLSKAGYRVQEAADGKEAWNILKGEDPPRLMILDWLMPGIEGVEICRKLRNLSAPPYHYIILLSAKKHQANIIEGLEAGADDYIIKPFDPVELVMRVRAGERILSLQNALLQAQESLRYQAEHDPLTGLLNHGAILQALDRELKTSLGQKKPMAVIMCDVDRFKVINDTYGHSTGDLVLKEVAKRLLKTVKNERTVGRYGGEEFLAFCSGLSTMECLGTAEKLRQAVSSAPISANAHAIPVTISVGLAITLPSESIRGEELIAQADSALYQAKALGRNRVCCYQGVIPTQGIKDCFLQNAPNGPYPENR